MDYRKLVDAVSIAKRETLSNKLIDAILLSKNDEKMPSQLANTILHHWQEGTIVSEFGLTALLEAAVLLEPAKTADIFAELELANEAALIREMTVKT